DYFLESRTRMFPGSSLPVVFFCVSCNSVGDKIYVDFKDNIPCVRLLNATHQIGCQSSLSGDVGVLHLLESEENLDWVLSSGPDPPYMVMLESTLFTRSVMMKLKSSSNRVAGVVVVAPNTNPSAGFSPHASCPNENSGVYTEKYSPSLAHCNATVWNPLGNNLSYEEFDFPIFSLKDDNDTQAMRQCYMDHNRPVNGSKPRYPLCAMQLFSHMSAVTDTATCMRRNSIAMSLNPEFVCDPLGDVNIWALSKPLNVTEKGHKPGESVIIAAARLDSRSFFFDIAPGAESTASGLVTLLAVAHALRNATQEAQLNTTIMYTFFHGETFDYIGSSRMVFDMERNQSIIDLDNVHSVLEVGQVGLHGDTKLWLHSDPVSRRNSSIDEEVCVFFLLNFSVEEPGSSQALPPSSFQRFLRARPIPGVVIENHQSTFTNRYYQSMYDNSDYLNVSYPPGLTPEEQLDFVTDAAKVLFVVTLSVLSQVSRLLYSFLVMPNNSWFQQIITSSYSKQISKFIRITKSFISINAYFSSIIKTSDTRFTFHFITVMLCRGFVEQTDELYYYVWAQGAAPPNGTEREGFCVRSTCRTTKAVSPAFELEEYTSSNYSTWTESRWKSIKGRIFLVASHDLEMLTLGVGVGVLLTSLLLTFFISSKADILFNSGREPTNATY
uniref:Nicastrin n=1 Tax=Nothobranchius furzeri TaxID=105023 RepID=A0A8C6PLK8_NOTFU